jgi:hypothetical protein
MSGCAVRARGFRANVAWKRGIYCSLSCELRSYVRKACAAAADSCKATQLLDILAAARAEIARGTNGWSN